jgi:hypothetical protein
MLTKIWDQHVIAASARVRIFATGGPETKEVPAAARKAHDGRRHHL